MDAEEDNYDMLDLLAYNCNDLTEKLSEENPSNHDQIILDYLKKADGEHKKINDFKEDLDWFNVTEPLNLELLQGKIVILDFFTYCCINCMHILPDLKKLEQRYSVENGLVVVGVHSAKFDNEKDSANILSAVQRYNIIHPVVNDTNMSMWTDLKIRCWPSMLILGPNGNPLFIFMGEGNYDTLQKYIDIAIKYYRSIDAIKSHSLPLHPSTELLQVSCLKFPGKIACSKNHTNNADADEMYAIADSGNHRIIIITSFGKIVHKIGGKDSGFIDGAFDMVRFDSPQGLTFLDENTIYVCDTENHAIRKIDLKLMIVETIAGTGQQGNDRIGGKIGKLQELSSPWDITVYRTRDMDMSFHIDEQSIPEKNILLVASAGMHQIWAIFLEDTIWWKYKKYIAGTVIAVAGSGQEENRNNSYPQNAAFAQPSGLAVDRENKHLYIADSESSCIRKLSLSDGKVLPVVGGDRNPLNLFAFGDKDGTQFTAKLQHPLGVAFNMQENLIYVADTYNHKIKKIDLSTLTLTTCQIKNQLDEIKQFNEPAGLCLNGTGKILYVADTNNHQIEKIDLMTMKTTALKLISDNAEIQQKTNTANNCNDANNELIKYSNVIKIKPQGGLIQLHVILMNGIDTMFTENAPQKWHVQLPNSNWTIVDGNKTNGCIKLNEQFELKINVPGIENSQAEEIIQLSYHLMLCAGDLCFPKLFTINFTVAYSNDGLENITEVLQPVITRDSVVFL